MRKIILLLFLFVSSTFLTKAQTNHVIRISGDLGIVANSNNERKFGMGGTVSWLAIDNQLSKNGKNYLSLSIKGFNNPYGEGKLLTSILNDKNDALNYLMPLVGYRITFKDITNGFFLEPRVGAIFGASGYKGFAFSPMAGYGLENFNIAIYLDMGFGNKNSPILKKNIVSPGISIGYMIPIARRKSIIQE